MKPHRLLISLLMTLTLSVGVGYAQSSTSAQQDKIARLEQEIKILNQQIKDNSAKGADALSRLSLIQSRISKRQELIAESNAKIAALDGQIRTKQNELDAKQAQLDTMMAYYSRLIRSAYKNRDARVWYMYILASENISQGIRRFSFFRGLSTQMSHQAESIKQSQAQLKSERDALVALRAEQQALRNKQLAEVNSLKAEETQLKSLSNRLKKDKRRYQNELAAKKKQSDALEREIRRAINSAVGPNKGVTGKPKKPIDYTLAGEFVANKGKLPWPIEGAVTGGFGRQFHSVFKNLQLPANNGINISVAPDAEVKSVFDGVVAQITVLPGYHQCILVQHGNYFTLYAKIKNTFVKAGDKVKTGQRLGTVDTIGGETTFHFEIWDEKTRPQDPEIWLRPQ